MGCLNFGTRVFTSWFSLSRSKWISISRSSQASMMCGFLYYPFTWRFYGIFPYLYVMSNTVPSKSCFAQCALRPLCWKNLGRTKSKSLMGSHGRNLISLPGPLGQLTSLGYRQCCQAGQHLRRCYPAASIRAFSTEPWRTFCPKL